MFALKLRMYFFDLRCCCYVQLVLLNLTQDGSTFSTFSAISPFTDHTRNQPINTTAAPADAEKGRC